MSEPWHFSGAPKPIQISNVFCNREDVNCSQKEELKWNLKWSTSRASALHFVICEWQCLHWGEQSCAGWLQPGIPQLPKPSCSRSYTQSYSTYPSFL